MYLATTEHSTSPLIVDRTPPVAGRVSDGSRFNHDISYTAVDDSVCANWNGFHDRESGIAKVALLGVGSQPYLADVASLQAVDYNTKESCIDVSLHHGRQYFATVVVFNGGDSQLSTNASSDGGM